MNKAQALSHAVKGLTKRQKVLLGLKVLTTWLLGLTFVTMLCPVPMSVRWGAWVATFLVCHATVFYGVHVWFAETGEEK